MSKFYQRRSLPDIIPLVRSVCFVLADQLWIFVSVVHLVQLCIGLVCQPDCPSPSNQSHNQDPDFPPFPQDLGELYGKVYYFD